MLANGEFGCEFIRRIDINSTVSPARICCDKRVMGSQRDESRPLEAMTKLKISVLLIAAASVAVAPALEAKPKKRAHHNAARVVSGRASYHQHTGQMVTAARVPRGSKLWVWHGDKAESSGFAVTVNDAGPFVRGRVLDLSTGAFARLYGGLGRGHGPVRYRVLS